MTEKYVDINRFEGVTWCEPTACSKETTCNHDSPASATEIQKHPKSALPAPSVILGQSRRQRGGGNSEKPHTQTKKAREFARRMIADGLMPLETVSRLTGMSLTMVHELAAEVARQNRGRQDSFSSL